MHSFSHAFMLSHNFASCAQTSFQFHLRRTQNEAALTNNFSPHLLCIMFSKMCPTSQEENKNTQNTQIDLNKWKLGWTLSLPQASRAHPVQCCSTHQQNYVHENVSNFTSDTTETERGGGLGSRPKKVCVERLGDGVEYHLMSPTPRR